MLSRPGDLLLIDGRASVQFAGTRALLFRVISVSTQPTYYGWVWLTGYVLDRTGRATRRRDVYVQVAGLRTVKSTAGYRCSSAGSRRARRGSRSLAVEQ